MLNILYLLHVIHPKLSFVPISLMLSHDQHYHLSTRPSQNSAVNPSHNLFLACCLVNKLFMPITTTFFYLLIVSQSLMSSPVLGCHHLFHEPPQCTLPLSVNLPHCFQSDHSKMQIWLFHFIYINVSGLFFFATGTLSTAERSYPRPRSGAEAGRTPCPKGGGQEELPHVWGQGQRLRGDILQTRSEAVARRNYPMSPHPRSRDAAGRSYPTPEARGGGQEDQPHVQGAVAAQEELSHVEGQEGLRWGDTPRPM